MKLHIKKAEVELLVILYKIIYNTDNNFYILEKMMFDLFETFTEAYETRNFTLTANHLFITQSTVTKRLQKLEDELNTVLFCRKNLKEIVPTNSADELYPIALNFLKEWNVTQNHFRNKSSKQTLKIGITQSSAISILPSIFNIIKDELDDIDLKIRIYDSKKILSLVESKELNIGIIDQNFSSPQVIQKPLFQDRLVLAGNIKTEIMFVREIKLQIGCLTKKIIQQNKYQFEKIVSVNDYQTIIEFIKNDMGMGFLPQKLVPKNVTFQTLKSDYILHYSFIHHYNESDKMVQDLILKIKKGLSNLY